MILILTLGNGSGTDFGASQCIAMDLCRCRCRSVCLYPYVARNAEKCEYTSVLKTDYRLNVLNKEGKTRPNTFLNAPFKAVMTRLQTSNMKPKLRLFIAD